MSRTNPKNLRRTFSEEQKTSLLTEAAETSIKEVAEKYQISSALLFDWRAKARRKNSSNSNLQLVPIETGECQAEVPSLTKEYSKLAKIQASLSNKLHREIQKGEITAYAAGCTLVNLYNGISKLESFREQIKAELEPEDSPKKPAEGATLPPELRRDAKKLLSAFMQEKQNVQE